MTISIPYSLLQIMNLISENYFPVYRIYPFFYTFQTYGSTIFVFLQLRLSHEEQI